MTAPLTTAFDPHAAPGYLVRRAYQRHAEVWAELVGNRLTSPQFAALFAIVRWPGIDQVGVGRFASLDSSTCQDVVRRLCSRGLVRTSRSRVDARRRTLTPTEAGATLLADVLPHAEQVGVRLLENLSAAEATQLAALLTKLNAPASSPS
jgi:DNA-binding MarR family transcriptional regulator